MSNSYIELSPIDRIMNLRQIGELNSINKTTQGILAQQKRANQELSRLNSQVELLNKQVDVNNQMTLQILKNQIKEIENKEEQKFYKSLVFNLGELVEQIKLIDNPLLQYYFFKNYELKISTNLASASSKLEEINDKVFTKKIIENAESIKEFLYPYKEKFETSLLSQLDSLAVNFKKTEENLRQKQKESEYLEPPYNKEWDTSTSRYFGIFFLTLFSISSISMLFDISSPVYINGKLNIIYYCIQIFIFITPLLLILKKEVKKYKAKREWKKEIEARKKYLKENATKIVQEKEAAESRINEILSNLAFYKTLKEIEIEYPNFNYLTDKISRIDKF